MFVVVIVVMNDHCDGCGSGIDEIMVRLMVVTMVMILMVVVVVAAMRV